MREGWLLAMPSLFLMKNVVEKGRLRENKPILSAIKPPVFIL